MMLPVVDRDAKRTFRADHSVRRLAPLLRELASGADGIGLAFCISSEALVTSTALVRSVLGCQQ